MNLRLRQREMSDRTGRSNPVFPTQDHHRRQLWIRIDPGLQLDRASKAGPAGTVGVGTEMASRDLEPDTNTDSFDRVSKPLCCS